MPEPLPTHWIDRLFTKLMLTYGAPFMARYDGLDLAMVKAEWAEGLAGYQAHDGLAIKLALGMLPDRAPNLIEFRALCRAAPTPTTKALQGPVDKPNPEMLAMVAKGLEKAAPPDAKQWARDLQEKDAAGVPLTVTQRAAYRAALGLSA